MPDDETLQKVRKKVEMGRAHLSEFDLVQKSSESRELRKKVLTDTDFDNYQYNSIYTLVRRNS